MRHISRHLFEGFYDDRFDHHVADTARHTGARLIYQPVKTFGHELLDIYGDYVSPDADSCPPVATIWVAKSLQST